MLALAGMAVANVLLPSLVKLHFPDRIGRVTALYTATLAVGLTGALTLTVPIAEAGGGWRVGLAAWAVVAALAALPWLRLVGHDRHLDPGPHDVRLSEVARTRLGLGMALFFGLQSMHAYAIFGWFAQLWRDEGYSPTAAGLLVGLVAATSVPLSLWLPAAAARRHDQSGILLAVMACYPVAYVGLMLAPHDLAVVWAVVVGAGTCTFPLILTLIGLRSRTPAGTAALSGFTQSAGYLLAALGPFTVGAALRRDRRLDRAAVVPDRADRAAGRRRLVRRPAGVRRGPAARCGCRQATDRRRAYRRPLSTRGRPTPSGRGGAIVRRSGQKSVTEVIRPSSSNSRNDLGVARFGVVERPAEPDHGPIRVTDDHLGCQVPLARVGHVELPVGSAAADPLARLRHLVDDVGSQQRLPRVPVACLEGLQEAARQHRGVGHRLDVSRDPRAGRGEPVRPR